MSLRPLGFVRWVAPRRPLAGIFLIAGLLLAYGANRVHEFAMRAALRSLDSFFAVPVEVQQMDVSLLRGVVDIGPLRIGEEAAKTLDCARIVARFRMDWVAWRPRITALELHGPKLRLVRAPDGRWNLESLISPAFLEGARAARVAAAHAMDRAHEMMGRGTDSEPQPAAKADSGPSSEAGGPAGTAPPGPGPGPGEPAGAELLALGLPRLRITAGDIHLTGPNLTEPLLFRSVDLDLVPQDDGTLALFGEGAVLPESMAGEGTTNQLAVEGRLTPGTPWTGKTRARIQGGDLATLKAFLGDAIAHSEGALSGTLSFQGPVASPHIGAMLDIADAEVDLGKRGKLVTDEARVRFDNQGGQQLAWEAGATRVHLSGPQGEVETRAMRARVIQGRHQLHVEALTFEAGLGRFGGKGTIPLESEGEWSISVQGRDLPGEFFGTLIGEPWFRTRGSIRFDGSLVGTPEAPRAALSFGSSDLAVEVRGNEDWVPIEFRSVTGRLSATTDVIHVTELVAARGDCRIDAKGTVPVHGAAPGELRVELDRYPVSLPASFIASGVARQVEGTLDAKLQLAGTASDFTLRGQVQRGHVLWHPTDRARGLDIDALSLDLDMAVKSGRSQGKIGRLTAQVWGRPVVGRLDWAPGTSRGEVRVDRLPLERVVLLFDRPPFKAVGALTAALSFSSAPDALVVEGDARVPALPFTLGVDRSKHRSNELEDLALAFAYEKTDGAHRAAEVLQVRRGACKAFGGAVDLAGRVELNRAPHVEVQLKLDQVDTGEISALLDREDLSFGGVTSLEGTLVGPLKTPEFAGSVSMNEPQVRAHLGEKTLEVRPDSLTGRLRVSPGHVQLGPLEGGLAGGTFDLDLDLDLADPAQPWRISANARDLDLGKFAGMYLDQPHEISGQAEASLLLHGKGADRSGVTGYGRLDLTGAVKSLQALDQAEETHKFRNLRDIEIKTCRARIAAIGGQLRFRGFKLRTTHGGADGDITVGLDGKLDGGVKVAVHRKILSSGHRFLTAFEGGRFFNFRLDLDGTLAAPEYIAQTKVLGIRKMFRGKVSTGSEGDPEGG